MKITSTLRQAGDVVAHDLAPREALPELARVAARYAVAITPAVAELIDPTDPDGKWAAVKVKPVAKLASPVSLKTIKATPDLAEMELLRLSRLSVSAVKRAEWDHVLAMAGGTV